MEDQWRLVTLVAAKAPGAAEALLDAGQLHQISRELSRLYLGHIPGHHLAAPDIDHQKEVKPDPSKGGGQIGDVPPPDCIRSDRAGGTAAVPGEKPDRSSIQSRC